jgi:hypothetical protein
MSTARMAISPESERGLTRDRETDGIEKGGAAVACRFFLHLGDAGS